MPDNIPQLLKRAFAGEKIKIKNPRKVLWDAFYTPEQQKVLLEKLQALYKKKKGGKMLKEAADEVLLRTATEDEEMMVPEGVLMGFFADKDAVVLFPPAKAHSEKNQKRFFQEEINHAMSDKKPEKRYLATRFDLNERLPQDFEGFMKDSLEPLQFNHVMLYQESPDLAKKPMIQDLIKKQLALPGTIVTQDRTIPKGASPLSWNTPTYVGAFSPNTLFGYALNPEEMRAKLVGIAQETGKHPLLEDNIDVGISNLLTEIEKRIKKREAVEPSVIKWAKAMRESERAGQAREFAKWVFTNYADAKDNSVEDSVSLG